NPRWLCILASPVGPCMSLGQRKTKKPRRSGAFCASVQGVLFLDDEAELAAVVRTMILRQTRGHRTGPLTARGAGKGNRLIHNVRITLKRANDRLTVRCRPRGAGDRNST